MCFSFSLQPCMHVFCAACYSGWMERSSLCPTCRCPVERIRKNHILNNLVEAYLLQHPGWLIYPAFYTLNSQEGREFSTKKTNRASDFSVCVAEKCRSEEDLKSMDSRNKITQDMLQPKVERSFSDEEGSSDYLFEFSDNDSDSSDMRWNFSVIFCVFATCLKIFFKCSCRSIFVLVVHSQPIMVCRQCPGYQADVSQLLFPTAYWHPVLPASALVPTRPVATEGCAKAAGEQPSTSSDIPSSDGEYHHLKFSLRHSGEILKMAVTPRSNLWVVPFVLTFWIRVFAPASCAAPQEYRCPPRGFHLVCTCCLQPMPDRRAELSSQQVAQQCEWWLNPLTQA